MRRLHEMGAVLGDLIHDESSPALVDELGAPVPGPDGARPAAWSPRSGDHVRTEPDAAFDADRSRGRHVPVPEAGLTGPSVRHRGRA